MLFRSHLYQPTYQLTLKLETFIIIIYPRDIKTLVVTCHSSKISQNAKRLKNSDDEAAHLARAITSSNEAQTLPVKTLPNLLPPPLPVAIRAVSHDMSNGTTAQLSHLPT